MHGGRWVGTGACAAEPNRPLSQLSHHAQRASLGALWVQDGKASGRRKGAGVWGVSPGNPALPSHAVTSPPSSPGRLASPSRGGPVSRAGSHKKSSTKPCGRTHPRPAVTAEGRIAE